MEISNKSIGVAGLAVGAFVAVLGAVGFATGQLKDPRQEVLQSREAAVVGVEIIQAESGSYFHGVGIADTQQQTVIETTGGRFVVAGVWRGMAGEHVELRSMRGGAVLLCRQREPCKNVMN